MRGFETGLFLRTKGGTVEEYGCTPPTDTNKKAGNAFEMVKSNIELAMNTLKLDPVIEEAFTVVFAFIDGLNQFMAILKPESRKELD